MCSDLTLDPSFKEMKNLDCKAVNLSVGVKVSEREREHISQDL